MSFFEIRNIYEKYKAKAKTPTKWHFSRLIAKIITMVMIGLLYMSK